MTAYAMLHGYVHGEITGVEIDGVPYSIARIRSALATPSSPDVELQAEVERLREWKSAIIGLCKAIGSNDMPWGGDKTGWGFIHYFVKHLHTRAEAAEARASSAVKALEEEREACAKVADTVLRQFEDIDGPRQTVVAAIRARATAAGEPK